MRGRGVWEWVYLAGGEEVQGGMECCTVLVVEGYCGAWLDGVRDKMGELRHLARWS